jgi:copper chaperone CopZ
MNTRNTSNTRNTRRVTVPAISSAYCSRLIKRELGTIEGVKVVVVNLPLREVEIEWQPPATWEVIVRMLKEIEYPPKEN